LQDHKGSAAPHRPSASHEHTPVTTDLPSPQDRKDTSAASPPPVVPEYTVVEPELTSLSQSVSGAHLLILDGGTKILLSLKVNGEDARTKSRIKGNESIEYGAERDVKGPPSMREEQKSVMAPAGRENWANVEPNPTTGRVSNILQYQNSPPESSLPHESVSLRRYFIVKSCSYITNLTALDVDTGLSIADGGKAQQRTGSKDGGSDSGDRVRPESMSATKVVVSSCH